MKHVLSKKNPVKFSCLHQYARFHNAIGIGTFNDAFFNTLLAILPIPKYIYVKLN